MPQSNNSPQLPNEPENSAAAILARYKTEIEGILNLLFYGENLRKIREDDIDAFERDLREVIQGIEKLRHIPDLNHLLTSIDAVQESIRSAIDELYIALHVIERQDTEAENSWRAFYTCLANCRRYLTKTLQYFRVKSSLN